MPGRIENVNGFHKFLRRPVRGRARTPQGRSAARRLEGHNGACAPL